MTDGKRFVSLRVKLLAVMLGGLALLAATFFLTEKLGDALIREYYMSEEAVHRRNMADIEQLQSYIKEHGLSSRDTEEIARWTISKENVYILFYQNRHLAMEAGWWGIDESEPIGQEKLDDVPSVTPYPVSFRDGVFQAVIYDFSQTALYDAVRIVSIALSCGLFALLMLLYTRRITRAIVAISGDIQQIGRGNLNFRMDARGNDELSQLVQSVDAMRCSLQRTAQEEQEALKKNSELITAMSHDLRNPLTALMGYLDLARSGQYRSPEELQRYLDAGYGRAEQLKALTEELFRYALVFGGRELDLQLQEYDAVILLEQLLGEQVVSLREFGYRVHLLQLNTPCRVRMDVAYFNRVLENLFDNVRKYADPEKPVVVAALKEEGWLHVCMENSVREDPNPVERNRIGLKTCERIMAQLGGSFRKQEQDGKFTAELLLPLAQDTAET